MLEGARGHSLSGMETEFCKTAVSVVIFIGYTPLFYLYAHTFPLSETHENEDVRTKQFFTKTIGIGTFSAADPGVASHRVQGSTTLMLD